MHSLINNALFFKIFNFLTQFLSLVENLGPARNLIFTYLKISHYFYNLKHTSIQFLNALRARDHFTFQFYKHFSMAKITDRCGAP